MSRLPPAVVLTSIVAFGCGPTTEDGHLDIGLGLVFSGARTLESGAPVLRGARVCPEVRDLQITSDQFGGDGLGACYAVEIEGPVVADEDCWRVDGLGEIVIAFHPTDACPFPDVAERATKDRFRLNAIEADGLRARLEWWRELAAELYLHPGPAGAFPADWIPAPDEPWLAASGARLDFSLAIEDATGRTIAWSDEATEARIVDAVGEPSFAPAEDAPSPWTLSLRDGERVALELQGLDRPLPLGEVVGVDAGLAAASLSIVAAYEGDSESGLAVAPFAARAIVRDAQGRMILGAPVAWEVVDGPVLAWTSPDFGPPDYVQITGACEAPPPVPEARRAMLRAALGELVDEVELEWVAQPADPDDEPWSAPPECSGAAVQPGAEGDGEDGAVSDRGCACGRDPERLPPLLLALALAIAGGARRRRSSVSPARSG